MKRYVVRCRVSGGVTGARESLLKHNGAVVYFETKQAAAAEAARIEGVNNSNPFRTASFRYTAEEE